MQVLLCSSMLAMLMDYCCWVALCRSRQGFYVV
jgi:hypothetical protein